MKQKTDYNPGQYYNLYIDKEKRPYTPIHIDKNENVVTFFIKDYENNKISEKICRFETKVKTQVFNSYLITAPRS